MTIDRWGRFTDPAIEALFREYHCLRERRLALLSLAIGILVTVVFGFSDRQILGLTPAFWWLLGARAVFAAGSAVLLLMIGISRSPVVMDRLMLVWACSGTALLLFVGLNRPGIYFLGQVFISLFVVWIFYFTAPLTYRVQVAVTFVIVGGHLYLLVARHGDLNPVLFRSALVGYLLTAVVSMSVSRNLNELRREQFARLQQEIGLRGRLEAAVAEIRTLQGILPICAYCKSIRNDQGSWQKLEVYVQEHSQAEFSHGICPDCLQVHFSDVVRPPKRASGT